jgi:hypothetical protein
MPYTYGNLTGLCYTSNWLRWFGPALHFSRMGTEEPNIRNHRFLAVMARGFGMRLDLDSEHDRSADVA